jgi:hypothetical protein
MMETHLEVAHDMGVLQPAERGHLSQQAGKPCRRFGVQADALQGVLPAVQAVDGRDDDAGGAPTQLRDFL